MAMKIAVWHNLPSGGGKRALYYHVRGLIERGHTVEIWTLSTSDRAYLPLSELSTEHVIDFEWEPKSFPTKVGRIWGKYQNAVNHIRATDAVNRLCAEEIECRGFDLLFVNSCVLYRAPFITRHVRIPTVMYLGEPYRALYEANPTLPWIAPLDNQCGSLGFRIVELFRDLLRLQALRLRAREEWVNARAADLLLVNSYYTRESILKVYGLDAKVCYLGVDTVLFRDLGKRREDFVVGLGAFTRTKEIDFAVRCIARLPEPRPRLVWIGDKSNDPVYFEEILKLAKSLAVDFEPKLRISDQEIVDILNRALLMLYTSRLEPFGFAPLEAAACATPVVAVAEGGVRETVRDGVNGFLVDRDPAVVNAAIDRLRRDPALARQMGERGRCYVEREWNLDACIDRLEVCFHRVLDSKIESQVS